MVEREKSVVANEFKSNEEILTFFEKFKNQNWKHCRDNYDIVETKKIFANGAEIELSSDVILLNDAILLSAISHRKPYNTIIRILQRNHVSKIELLDNSEKKGAALILIVPSRRMHYNIRHWTTKETAEYIGLPCSYIVLTIPFSNSDENSIKKIKERLIAFDQTDDRSMDNEINNSHRITLEFIKFSRLTKLISPFNLKPISYISKKASSSQFIVIMNNNYSIKKSNAKLEKFLSSKKKLSVDSDNTVRKYSNVVRDNDVYKSHLCAKIFKSKNVETGEIYDATGRAFKSLFDNEWLHCDIIDTYLNEWRKRMEKVICNPFNKNGFHIKIFNTLLYTRLTRGANFTSKKVLNPTTLECIQENVERISCESVHCSSKVYRSIFDFDIIIIPIHVDDHWMTGIIYKPFNCLIDISAANDESMEVDDNTHSFIFVFDSMASNLTRNKRFCTFVLKEYLEACFKALKENLLCNKWRIDKEKIKIINLENPYQQNNGYDCGLFMLEFIRQILINPMSLDNLTRGHLMKKVYPNFSIAWKRNYLKLFVYSKTHLNKWIILNEMEEYIINYNCKDEFKTARLRSIKPVEKKNMIRRLKRSQSCDFIKKITITNFERESNTI